MYIFSSVQSFFTCHYCCCCTHVSWLKSLFEALRVNLRAIMSDRSLSDEEKQMMNFSATVRVILPDGREVQESYGFKDTFDDLMYRLEEYVQDDGMHDLYSADMDWIHCFDQLEKCRKPIYMLGSLSKHERPGDIRLTLQLKHETRDLWAKPEYTIQYYQRLLAMSKNYHANAKQVWVQKDHRLSGQDKCSTIDQHDTVTVLL